MASGGRVLGLCVALAAAAGGCAAPSRELAPERPAAKAAASFRWIDPLLDCESNRRAAELRHFERDLDSVSRRLTDGRRVSRVAIYFRDLRNGPWFGVNEDEPFLPASLLKVPLMVAILDRAEEEPGLLSETLRVPDRPDLPLDPLVPPSRAFVAGSTHTVDALLSAMIRRSDNVAMEVLARRVGVEGIRRFYEELGVLVPDDGVPDFLSVRDFASIFRILYNASYLDRRHSERALDELSRSEFRDGIVRPLPASLPVAHKFGERKLPGAEQQFHDCGIVYYPRVPYVLCVMTRGNDIEPLKSAIQEISRIVFETVSRQYPAKP